ncbi:uncharacterized protein LOC135692697 [Rhopilema esculentum]|uniref:uncharacterized protein LOC135692697 n=1 Tax=Rhopilema esculentum TaxID=499914 RepID=UPI0031D63C95
MINQVLKMSTIGLLMVLVIVERAFSSDPIFKFIPKSSLSNLLVQHVSEYDITMAVGSNQAASTVISINGPFADGHAGMTGISMRTLSKGSNVNAPDFATAATQNSSTAEDGLHDVIYKNFSAVSRVTAGKEVVIDNTISLIASMKTVDKPGADSADTLWVWASAEVGDQYVWVSEEATTIKRSPGDNAYLAYTAKPLYNWLPFSGKDVDLIGTVRHTSLSRINAYNVKLRFYLPPYAEYISGTYTSAPLYSAGSLQYTTQESQNEIVISYSKIGITDQPDFKFAIKFKGSELELGERDRYNGTIEFLMSYCNKTDCSPNGAIKKFTKIISNKFRAREDRDKFYIKHIASGRCLSYANGDEYVTLKAACNDVFSFDARGGVKHVATAKCPTYTSNLKLGMSTSKCDSPMSLFMTASGLFQGAYWGSQYCLTPDGTGLEGDILSRTTSCTSNAKFKFVDAVPASSRLQMGNKVILYSGSREFFFCNRKSNFFKSSCFYKNGTYASSVKALPIHLVYVKAWDASKSELYGIGYHGASYVKINLNVFPHVAYQLDDSTFTAVLSQEGIKSSTNILESSLTNYPVQHSTSEFAVSLKGVYQQDSSTWKLVSRW